MHASLHQRMRMLLNMFQPSLCVAQSRVGACPEHTIMVFMESLLLRINYRASREVEQSKYRCIRLRDHILRYNTDDVLQMVTNLDDHSEGRLTVLYRKHVYIVAVYGLYPTYMKVKCKYTEEYFNIFTNW